MSKWLLSLLGIMLLTACASNETTRLSQPRTPDKIYRCQFGKCVEQNLAIEAPIALAGALLMVALEKDHSDFNLSSEQKKASPIFTYQSALVPYNNVRANIKNVPNRQPWLKLPKKH